MALRKRPIAAGIAALIFSGYVSALGLGEIRLNSALNEPLDAEIPLINLGELTEAEIIAGLASNKEFENAGVDREMVLTSLVFRLDLTNPSGPVLNVTSQKPVREPYLDFLIEVQWPSGRLLREYTLLLDLPVYAGGTFSKKNTRSSQPARSVSGSAILPASSTVAVSNRAVEAGEGEYIVSSGDTLWRIASRLPSSESVHQKMADIQQLNPEAFINGDMNLIKNGAVLRLPDYARSYAGGGAVQADHAGESAYGSPEDSSPPQAQGSYQSEQGGRLSLTAESEDSSSGGALGSGGSGSSRLRGEIDSIQEELARTRRENSELKERLASLEGQISTMQRLVQLEDDELRAAQLATVLEGQASGDPEGTDAAGTGSGEPSYQDGLEQESSPALALFPSANTGPEPVTEQESGSGVESSGTPDGTPGSSMETVSPEQTAEPAGASTAEVSAPAKMEIKTEKGWFEKVSGYLILILGAAIAAIVFGVLRRKKKAERENFYQEPAARFTPPPAPAREKTPYQAPSQASSIDQIDLKEKDDLFAAPSAAPAATPIAAAATVTPRQAEPALPEDVELDLSEFDLDDITDGDSAGRGLAEPEPVADINLDEEFDFLGDIDEGDTQLELAQAYMEMGDNAGAREILMEVAEGGSDTQKAKARELLEQLG